MTIAITGASGLIGAALCRSLLADNIPVRRLVRRPTAAPDEVRWDPAAGTIDLAGLQGVSAIVHLAGAGVGDKRWNDTVKREIRQSRVTGTAVIAEAVAALPSQPALISGSAIGYYGDTGTAIATEDSPAGTTFLADVVVAWESAAAAAQEAGRRVAFARTGLVVSADGGAFGKMVPIFKAGIGGRLGSGDQWWSFISLTDEVRALRFLIDNDIEGPVNLVAPQPVTNRVAVADLGQALHRPAALPVPAFALRAALGGFADEIVASQGVAPVRLHEAGFTWAHPTLPQALAAEL